MIKAGDKAPDFELLDASEKPVKLSALRGKKVVLYFYPKDDTPGCTLEAINFSRMLGDLTAMNAVVLGISKDSCASHAKFSAKHKLSVTLLADTDTRVQQAYGVWQEKSFMGKHYMGTVRTTYLIDEQGEVAHVWENVKVAGHAAEVLARLGELPR